MRITNTSEKAYAPRNWVTITKAASNDLAPEGVIQIDWCANMIRVHDNCHNGGGAIIPMVSNCLDSAGNLPIVAPATIMRPIAVPANGTAAAVNTVVVHNLGYRPLVQIIDTATGALLNYPFTHNAANTEVTVTAPANAPAYQVIIR
jgi:hypothetical protein